MNILAFCYPKKELGGAKAAIPGHSERVRAQSAAAHCRLCLCQSRARSLSPSASQPMCHRIKGVLSYAINHIRPTSSVRGGKNSKEKKVSPFASFSLILSMIFMVAAFSGDIWVERSPLYRVMCGVGAAGPRI